MNDTPSANRTHIGFFGCRNTGKSSLVNAVTGQNLAIVSEIKGTTTDPVYKAMELLPLGPVVIIDTPGIDDEGDLGEQRIRRTIQVLNKTDIAVLVLDNEELVIDNYSHKGTKTEELINKIKEKNIPFIIALNKYDLSPFPIPHSPFPIIPVSAKTGYNINLLKEKIAALAAAETPDPYLVADLIQRLDIVLLVVPIDKAAPKGRLILPQQQVIREIIEAGAIALVVRDFELKDTLAKLEQKPALVICDSQVFEKVSGLVLENIRLTSFSILFARYKGFLETAVKGVKTLESLHDGDKILICEGCTHHRQCDDIGTVKIPRMIKKFSGKEPSFSFCSGRDFPEDLSPYKIIIHCGACMLNKREMQYRHGLAEDQNIPFTNYGISIAFMQGILERSTVV